jgi:hypothetical protein
MSTHGPHLLHPPGPHLLWQQHQQPQPAAQHNAAIKLATLPLNATQSHSHPTSGCLVAVLYSALICDTWELVCFMMSTLLPHCILQGIMHVCKGCTTLPTHLDGTFLPGSLRLMCCVCVTTTLSLFFSLSNPAVTWGPLPQAALVLPLSRRQQRLQLSLRLPQGVDVPLRWQYRRMGSTVQRQGDMLCGGQWPIVLLCCPVQVLHLLPLAIHAVWINLWDMNVSNCACCKCQPWLAMGP